MLVHFVKKKNWLNINNSEIDSQTSRLVLPQHTTRTTAEQDYYGYVFVVINQQLVRNIARYCQWHVTYVITIIIMNI